MEFEKTVLLDSGRTVKIIAHEPSLEEKGDIKFEVLIKEPQDEHFRPPIGLSHPKYWKLRKMDADKSILLKLCYSGLSEKQARLIVQELNRKLFS